MELDDVAPPKRSSESIDSLRPGQVAAAAAVYNPPLWLLLD